MEKLVLILTVIISANLSFAQADTINVQVGWNLIGSVSTGTVSNLISTIPPYIIISSFYGYGPPYLSEDTLKRSSGYWVKVSQAGKIIIQSPEEDDPCDGLLIVYYEVKTYNTLKVGDQCWLRENLNVGTKIDGIQNQTNNGLIEKYCYNNDSINCLVYGGLYQWNEAMQYSTSLGAKGICPEGWHIPTYAEFQILATTVGSNGNILKRADQGSGSGQGTNTSGFSALLAGNRYNGSNFYFLGNNGTYWSSTEYGDTMAEILYLVYNDSNIHFSNDPKINGFSIRCLKD